MADHLNRAVGFEYFVKTNESANLTLATNGTHFFCIFSQCLRLPLLALWAVEWLLVPFLLWTLTLTLWRIYNDEKKDPSSNLPLPPGGYGIPLLGETIAFFRQRSNFYDERRSHYGNIFKTHLLGRPTVRLIGSAALSAVVRHESSLVEVSWPKSVVMLLGKEAISILEGNEAHAKCKRGLKKAFTMEAMEMYLPHTLELIRQHIKRWCNQDEVLVYPSCRLVTSTNAARVFIGLKERSDNIKGEQFDISRWYQAQQCLSDNVFSLPIRLPWGLSGLSRGMRARNYLLGEVDAALERVRRGENEECVLSLLEKAGDIREQELKDNILQLLFAGHESLSTAMCNLVMEIGQRPDVFAKIEQELCDHNLFETSENAFPDIDELKRLNYVTSVVKESLRLLPPVGGVFRRAKKTFEIDGYQIPAGWSLIYAIRDTHKESPLFDPEFRPERWTELNESRTRFHYLPFSLGGHACLGREYAMIFLRAWVVELVRSTTWTLLSKNLPPEMEVLPSPRPKDKLPVKFVLRNSK